MKKEQDEYIRKIIEYMKKIQYVKPEDIPNIDLYMDQVTTFMDKHLESFKRYEADKLLTKTMINNYTKNNLLPSPEKKKYSKDHMFFLIFIYYMKSFMSITDIQSLLKPLSEKFFEKKSEMKLENIYKEVFRMEEVQAESVIKDVIRKFERSIDAFANIEDEEDAEFLRMFLFICMLCFDVYMKKQLIEKMIDEYFVLPKENKGKDKTNDTKNDKDKKSKEK